VGDSTVFRSGARSSGGLTVTIEIEGLREALDALGQIGKEANGKIRDKAGEIAEEEAGRVRAAGRAEGRQAAIVAGTVKVRRDRVPVVQAGGGARIGRRKKPAGKLLFGSEFGATYLRQYKPHLGREGYWFFPTITDDQPLIERQWLQAADEILALFGSSRG
jgi:hypothetical protein